MKIAAIIAEYNPFHNGHLYHIEETKRMTHADKIIIIMSGNFVQRGTPAIFDKYMRTKMALQGGGDVVLELPTYFATGSAELFAMGAVSILHQLNCVDFLSFGSECGDIKELLFIAQILVDEPTTFKQELKAQLKKGQSFPSARSIAFTQYLKSLTTSLLSPEKADVILASPNNTLGIEYLKALIRLNSSMIPVTLLRKGASYHDTLISESFGPTFCSATALRTLLAESTTTKQLAFCVPQNIKHLFYDNPQNLTPLFENDFSALLHYKLLLDAPTGYTQYADVSFEISNKIKKYLHQFTSYRDFCDLLKTKEHTYTRVSRCLLHILLDIKKNTTEHGINGPTSYIRILGFQKEDNLLLGILKKQCPIPLLTKVADAKSRLIPAQLNMLHDDILASHIYNLIHDQKYHISCDNEYQHPLVLHSSSFE